MPLQSTTIEHPLKQGKLNVFGKIISNLLKMHKYFLTHATYLMVNDYEAIQYSQWNFIIRFGFPNSLVFYITYFCLIDCLLWIIQNTIVTCHKNWHDTFYITHRADRVTSRIPFGTFFIFSCLWKESNSLPGCLFIVTLTSSICMREILWFFSISIGKLGKPPYKCIVPEVVIHLTTRG